MKKQTGKNKTQPNTKTQKNSDSSSSSNVERKQSKLSQGATKSKVSHAGFSEQGSSFRPSQIDADEWTGGDL